MRITADHDDLKARAMQRVGREPRFRKGTIVTFNPVTLENVVLVGETLMVNLGLLGVAEADTYTAGAQVIIQLFEGSWSIIGRYVTPGSAAATDAISRLANNTVSASVTAGESTTSTTFVNLTTIGPSVNPTVRASGKLLVVLSASMLAQDTGASSGAYMAVDVVASNGSVIITAAGFLGALSFEYSDNAAHLIGDSLGAARVSLLNLAPDTYTVTARYSSASGANDANFFNRNVTCISI